VRYLLLISLFFVHLSAEETIQPREFTVKLIKRCESLALSEEPNRKAKKIYTRVWTEGCVQNFGCLREVTQKELDDMNETTRNHMAWKYPVWCKVDADGKRGWVRKQFLSDEPCKLQE
jgi:hypothetical protein